MVWNSYIPARYAVDVVADGDAGTDYCDDYDDNDGRSMTNHVVDDFAVAAATIGVCNREVFQARY